MLLPYISLPRPFAGSSPDQPRNNSVANPEGATPWAFARFLVSKLCKSFSNIRMDHIEQLGQGEEVKKLQAMIDDQSTRINAAVESKNRLIDDLHTKHREELIAIQQQQRDDENDEEVKN